MALKSMTGYGRGTCTQHDITVTVELSSVNRKQLDIHIRLPRELSRYEAQVQAEIQKKISRGRIHGEITIDCSACARSSQVLVDQQLIGAYLTQVRDMAQKFDLKDDLSISTFFALPDVIRVERESVDAEQIWICSRQALEAATDSLVLMRSTEGTALEQDIAERLQLLQGLLAEINELAPTVAIHYRDEMMKRLRQAELELDVDDPRLLKEIALFADRSDITEEMTRLNIHLVETGKLLHQDTPVGRALDFLAQEMFREINTIGSKANDGKIVLTVVAFKTELERVREQIQNIE